MPRCLVTQLLATLAIQWDNEISCCSNSPGYSTNRAEGKKKTKQKKTLQFIVACRIMAHLITPFLCEGIIARDITREEKGNCSHRHLFHYHKSCRCFSVSSFFDRSLRKARAKKTSDTFLKNLLRCQRPRRRWFAVCDKPLKAFSSALSPVISEEACSHRQVTTRKV